ncbi:MAG: hypothetical protein PHW10_01745 [Candidatus Peribacteraceae bacterium]|nr:hypothetical protein [Candidatus Peribacteraceae bacterium]
MRRFRLSGILSTILVVCLGAVGSGVVARKMRTGFFTASVTPATVNVALNKPTTEVVSPDALPQYRVPPSAAVDGNLNTWWATGSIYPARMTVDLQAEQPLVRSVIRCGGPYGGNAGTVYFQNAARTTLQQYSYRCAGAAVVGGDWTFSSPLSVRYIRIDAITQGDWINVNEIEAYVAMPQCSDGVDNDGDGAIDGIDLSCSGTGDNDETNPQRECQDGVDNDGDGKTDYPQDPQCISRQGSEGPSPFTCPAGTQLLTIKSDTQTMVNGSASVLAYSVWSWLGAFPNASWIWRTHYVTNPTANETVHFERHFSVPGIVTAARLTTAIDNTVTGSLNGNALTLSNNTFQKEVSQTLSPASFITGDNLLAFDATNIAGPGSTAETNPAGLLYGLEMCYTTSQCADGIDNDGDGKIDFPQDPGCGSGQDNDEYNAAASSIPACTATTTGTATLNSFTAPPEWQDAPSCQPPTIIADNLAAGTVLKISDISGNICGNGDGCPGQLLIPCATFGEVKIGFYNGSNTLVSERILGSVGTAGVTVPAGAVKAYLYYRDALAGRDGYGDNVAYGCFVSYSFTKPAACSSSAAPSSRSSSSVTTLVNKADLAVSALGPGSVVRGKNAAFRATVTNAGTLTATNVVLSNATLPPFVYDAGLNIAECTQVGTAVQCPPFDLAPGASRSFTFVYRTPVAAGSTCSVGRVATTVTATTATPESKTNNNNAVVQTVALCEAAASSAAFSLPGECRAYSSHALDPSCAEFCPSDGGTCRQLCGYDLSSLATHLCPDRVRSVSCATLMKTPAEAGLPRVTCSYECCSGSACLAATSDSSTSTTNIAGSSASSCFAAGRFRSNQIATTPPCCPGTTWVHSFYNSSAGRCEDPTIVDGPGLCTVCGNGTCESWEDRCACPADCPVTASSSSAASTAPFTIPPPASMFLRTDPLDSTKDALIIGGTSGNDTISITPGNASVVLFYNGTNAGNYRVTGHIIVYGFGGADTITISDQVSYPSWIIGGAGNDTLTAGGGRNLIVGGGGVDNLNGNMKDDLLIGANATIETDSAALTAIMKEWESGWSSVTQLSTVKAHLTGTPGGLNGSVYLTDGSTISDDGAVDRYKYRAGHNLIMLYPPNREAHPQIVSSATDSATVWIEGVTPLSSSLLRRWIGSLLGF